MFFKKRAVINPCFGNLNKIPNAEVIDDLFLVRENVRVILYRRSDGLFMINKYKWISMKNDTECRYSYWHNLNPTASFYDSILEARKQIFTVIEGID